MGDPTPAQAYDGHAVHAESKEDPATLVVLTGQGVHEVVPVP